MTTTTMTDFYSQIEHITGALRTATANRDDEVGNQSATLALLLTQQLIDQIMDTFPRVLS